MVVGNIDVAIGSKTSGRGYTRACGEHHVDCPISILITDKLQKSDTIESGNVYLYQQKIFLGRRKEEDLLEPG